MYFIILYDIICMDNLKYSTISYYIRILYLYYIQTRCRAARKVPCRSSSVRSPVVQHRKHDMSARFAKVRNLFSLTQRSGNQRSMQITSSVTAKRFGRHWGGRCYGKPFLEQEEEAGNGGIRWPLLAGLCANDLQDDRHLFGWVRAPIQHCRVGFLLYINPNPNPNKIHIIHIIRYNMNIIFKIHIICIENLKYDIILSILPEL